MQEPTRTTRDYLETMEQVPSQTYFLAALGSIGLSALMFLTGRRTMAYFIGLWAPTILSFALFYKLLRPSHEPMSEEMRQAAEKVRKTVS